MFCPRLKSNLRDEKTTINQLVTCRLHLFQSGQIQLLYDKSNTISSKSGKEFCDDPVEIQRAAQLAADLDNPRSAYARLVKHLSVASINDNNIDVLHDLHPPPLNPPLSQPQRRTKQSAKPKRQRSNRFTISPDEIITILSKLSRGKAAGPYLDSLDIFIKLANLHKRATTKDEHCFVDTATLAKFFTIIAATSSRQRTWLH